MTIPCALLYFIPRASNAHPRQFFVALPRTASLCDLHRPKRSPRLFPRFRRVVAVPSHCSTHSAGSFSPTSLYLHVRPRSLSSSTSQAPSTLCGLFLPNKNMLGLSATAVHSLCPLLSSLARPLFVRLFPNGLRKTPRTRVSTAVRCSVVPKPPSPSGGLFCPWSACSPFAHFRVRVLSASRVRTSAFTSVRCCARRSLNASVSLEVPLLAPHLSTA
ncbi:hypothetical protein TRVL_04359 [Trypanosoma vivax]|nr:hypothetical protein TRVL_04359 [Trypanosoma vivax]